MEIEDEQEIIRQAMSLIGRRTSERKKQTSAENGKKGGTHIVTDETREKLRLAQQARRERERLQKEKELDNT